MPGLSIHAGITSALADRNIFSTHCAGTSAGAIVSALDAAGHSADEIAGLVTGLTDSDVRAPRFAWRLRPWIDYWLSDRPIRKLFYDLLPADWSSLTKPLSVHVTRTSDGTPVAIDGPGMGIVPDCVYASMAIYGVFPPARLFDGNEYADGGAREYVPLPDQPADFDEIWLLLACGQRDTYRTSSGYITRLLRNAAWMMDDQIDDAVLLMAHFARGPEPGDTGPKVYVVRPQIPTPLGALHMDPSLYGEARMWTESWLQSHYGEGR